MGRKDWKTVSEDNLRRSAAAWRWLEVIASGERLAPNIDAALFSRWFTSGILIQHKEDPVVASLGNYSWGVLTLPLTKYIEGEVTYYAVDAEANVKMLHVTDLSDWKLVPHAPSRRKKGLVFVKTGEPALLVRQQLLNSKSGYLFFGRNKKKKEKTRKTKK